MSTAPVAGRSALQDEFGPRRRRRRWYTSLARDPLAVLGGVTLLVLAVIGLLAPRLAPFHPPEANDTVFFLNRFAVPHTPPFFLGDDTEPTLTDPSLPYDPAYPLGTDWESRDMLSLLLYGLRFSLPVGLLAVCLVALIGTALGLAAGWLGGSSEQLVLRAADLAEAVPAIIAYALFAAVVSDPATSLFATLGLQLSAIPVTALALSCVGWAPVARLVRAQVLSLKAAEWVEAAHATGVPTRRLVVRHILPHTTAAALVAASSQLPVMLLADGLLGGIGIGPRPPMDSLGELLFHEFVYTVRAPVFVLMPTGLIIAMSVGLTAFSDGLQRALDPETLR